MPECQKKNLEKIDLIDTFVAPACHEDVELLFQDEWLLLISKPTGLLSLSGKNPLNKDSVHFRLSDQFPTAALAHRLDLGTSGIMVVALDKTTNKHLTQQFQQRSVQKSYLALLYGHLDKDHGVISAPITKDNTLFPRVRICKDSGKPAITRYHVKERLEHPARTVVCFTPDTGRTHQLRIHSQAIGHPILGCDLYGHDKSQDLSGRLMLHAQTLRFVHPVSGETIKAECACPFWPAPPESSHG